MLLYVNSLILIVFSSFSVDSLVFSSYFLRGEKNTSWKLHSGLWLKTEIG